MADLTKQEQALLAQKAKVQAKRDAENRKAARITAQLKRLREQYTQERLMHVGALVAAAGLLWVEDATLEKAFARIAEALLPGEADGRQMEPPEAQAPPVRAGAHPASKFQEGEGE